MKVRELAQRRVVSVRADEALALAVQLMGWNGYRHLPVVDAAGRVVGILSDRDLLARTGGDPARVVPGIVSDAMSAPAIHVGPDTSLEEAAAILVRREIDALPVVEGGELVGLLTTTDVLGHVAQCAVPGPPREPTVGDAMGPGVDAIHADDLLADAAAQMTFLRVRHLPVVDAGGRVVGILSDRDIRSATGGGLLEGGWDERRAYVRGIEVGSVMTRSVRTARPEQPLSDVIEALVEGGFGAMPVVDAEDRLVGIVSYVDVLRFLGRVG